MHKISTLKKRQIDEKYAHWYDTVVQMNQIQEEISLVQWGQQSEFEYFSLKMKEPQKSMYADWPKNYKFTGIELMISLDLGVTERSTYSLLEFFGDIGGLLDFLKLIAAVMIGPVAKLALSMELLTGMFRVVPSKRHDSLNSLLHLQTGTFLDRANKSDQSEVSRPQLLI